MTPELQVTPKALTHIKTSLAKATEPPIGVRVDVRKAGCSGYEYHLEYAYLQSIKETDHQFSFGDLTILIDKAIFAKFLKGGTVIDFKIEGVNQGLSFDNPNVTHQCGCGESFTINE